MEHSTLVGSSILVVEDEPFIARCLQMILEGAGAEVHRAVSAREALHFAGQPKLSAAVLDCKHGIRGDHAVARRLTERGLPFLLYGARQLDRYEAWPDAPVVGKLASGAEIIETLRGLLRPIPSNDFAVVGVALGASESTGTHVRAMADVEALMKRRTARRPHRQSPL